MNSNITPCRRCGVKPKDLLAFRLELVRLLLKPKPNVEVRGNLGAGQAQGTRVCCLKKVSIIGLKS